LAAQPDCSISQVQPVYPAVGSNSIHSGTSPWLPQSGFFTCIIVQNGWNQLILFYQTPYLTLVKRDI
jgi:hypothetical protein